MSTTWRVTRLVGSFVIGLAAGILLNVPQSFPLNSIVWKMLVVGAVGRVAPVDCTIAALIRGKLRGSRIRFFAPILLDIVGIALVLAFLDLREPAFTFIGKVLLAAVIAGVIPGWPDGGTQFVALLKRRVATEGAAE